VTVRLCLPLCLLAAAAFAPQHPAATVNVLTYNIHHGEGLDRRLDLERVARVIEVLGADLVALQEVDVNTDRSGGVNQLAELARLTRMHAQFGKAIAYEGGAYGVAVLSRWPILGVAEHPLPGSADRETRLALTVRVMPFDLGPVVQFTSTHLDQGRDPADRLAQATRLNELLIAGSAPSILAGDINARRDTDVMQVIESAWLNTSAGVANSLTPDGRPRSRGDHILVRPDAAWRVRSWQVIDETVTSDHRPLLTELEWTGNH
jgi:endonuclease/exonuclease/phosphatase family metal-dependent hydrolase